MKAWIKECLRYGDIGKSFTPNHLLDIREWPHSVKLIKTNGNILKYIALSYCWGTLDRSFTTTSETYSRFIRGSSERDFPQTFRDIMLLANKLDVQYIWIDAVCIIQDTKDLEDQISKMGSIYQQAFLVVAADCAESVHAGFLRPRNEYSHTLYTPSTMRKLEKKLEQCTSPTISIDPADIQDTQIFFHNDRTCGHEFLVWNKPELSRTSLAANPVLYRAWCMQERLLAQRVIHFIGTEIVWECNHLVDCGCGELRRRGMRDSIKQNLYPIYILAPATDNKIDIDTALQWQHVVEDYTVGELTVEGDRLIAIAGFAREFQQYHSWRYFAGLWEKYFQYCLIWEVARYDIDRPEREFGNYVAPSWSWASARSPVKYAASINGAILVTISEVRCEPKIARDPFCGVRSGRCVLRGPTLRAYMESQDGEALCYIAPGSDLETTMIVTLDINSPERQVPNDPEGMSPSVLLVLIGASPSSSPHQICFTVLLLRRQSDLTFVCIGMARLSVEGDPSSSNTKGVSPLKGPNDHRLRHEQQPLNTECSQLGVDCSNFIQQAQPDTRDGQSLFRASTPGFESEQAGAMDRDPTDAASWHFPKAKIHCTWDSKILIGILEKLGGFVQTVTIV